MNKHKVIRSVSVVVLLGLIFSIGQFEIGKPNFSGSAMVYGDQLNLQVEQTRVVKVENLMLDLEKEISVHKELANKKNKPGQFSISNNDVDEIIIRFPEEHMSAENTFNFITKIVN